MGKDCADECICTQRIIPTRPTTWGKPPVSGDVYSNFRGKADYNKFPERVTAGGFGHCPSACPQLFSQIVHPDLKQWLQN